MAIDKIAAVMWGEGRKYQGSPRTDIFEANTEAKS